MLDVEQYRAWLKLRKASTLTCPHCSRTFKIEPETEERVSSHHETKLKAAVQKQTFAQWINAQTEREDVVGRVARDLISECERIGREVAGMRTRGDLRWHCAHASADVSLERSMADVVWREWLRSQEDK